MNAAATHRGLTIQQPWAFAIAEGFKTVENRTRRTNYRGPLLVHAGLKLNRTIPVVRYSRDAAIRLDELGGSGNFYDARGRVPSVLSQPHATLALGAVIATATLAGCHEAADGCCAPWGFPDVWHWELADVQPLRRAVPRNGALGLWKPDAALCDAVAAESSAIA
ncbi:ASCH domain-containing protein [Streptomyces niveiscabiei]|uniref:ASCH domain-containing protein n=1 Tax=Streptomyces niveiscabiei TaxID=164115 RepID=UPI0006EB6948|nr:ASCH domain-containing protein [Streptomyces niveiscabiei]